MNKKSSFILTMLVAGGLMLSGGSIDAKNDISAGTVIKGAGNPTLYYVGEDGKRYVFPNSNTYFSWFDDFSEVEEVSLDDLYEIPLGGNVLYKPGALLVKIQTDPKVYAVGANGKLKWVKSEAIAKALYGENWNKLIDDVPDSFFTNYEIDEPIESEDEYDPLEEEDQTPTISHNKNFKALVQARNRNTNEQMCGRLEGALERLQKRFERWGVEITDEADEVLEKCYSITDETSDSRKVELCHNGKTLSVDGNSVKKRIKDGDILGVCVNSDESADEATEDEDASDDDSASSTDESIIDDGNDDDSASSTDNSAIEDESDDDNASSTDDSVDDESETGDDGSEDDGAASTEETTS